MKHALACLAALLLAGAAAAQHTHTAPADASGDPHAVVEAFVVTGLRVDTQAPPPGSGVGRAGLRFADGGYVSIVHGKPYARGREVWGGLVGFGSAWVAGAHRATELFTTVPLMVGSTRLEPGAYSLFVTPHHNAWTLHVNRALGMHLADEYDAALDIARVDATPTVLLAPVDGLTWSFLEDGSALTLAWDRQSTDFPISRAH